MEKRFENFTMSILRLNKLVSKIKLHEMRGYNLKAIHVMCLYSLAESSNGLTASELCRLTLEDKAAISRALDLLREKGYVECDTQKYNSLIKLSAEGQKVAVFINEKAHNAVLAGGKDLTDSEREIFYKCLDSISENLDEYYKYISKNNI